MHRGSGIRVGGRASHIVAHVFHFAAQDGREFILIRRELSLPPSPTYRGGQCVSESTSRATMLSPPKPLTHAYHQRLN